MQFFRDMSTPAKLKKISDEVKANTVEKKVNRKGVMHLTTQRGQSKYLLDEIHEAAGARHLEGCKRAEAGCLMALMLEFMDEKNAFEMIDAVNKILHALYEKPNNLAQKLSDFSVSIQETFPDSKVSEHAKAVLHLGAEAATIRKKNYAAKIFHELGNQRQLMDTDILKYINELRYSQDWIDLITCVGFVVGSRLIEILQVSNYVPAEHNRLYIRVEGVAKDRNDPEGSTDPNKRTFIKPLIGGIQSQELIEMIGFIRKVLEDRYRVIERKLTRKQITNLVDAKVNIKIREIMGDGYTFHDTRGIYAAIAFEQYAPAGQAKTHFFSKVLGHQENSLQVSLGYQKFAIRRQMTEDDPNLVAKITTLEEKVRGIQKYNESLDNTLNRAQSLNRSTFVSMQSQDGKTINVRRQLHVRDKNETARMERLDAAAKDLIKNGIEPTYRNLLSLGYGSNIVRKYKKGVNEKEKTEQKNVE